MPKAKITESPMTWSVVKKMFGDKFDELPIYSVKIVHLDGKFETMAARENGKTPNVKRWREWAKDFYKRSRD